MKNDCTRTIGEKSSGRVSVVEQDPPPPPGQLDWKGPPGWKNMVLHSQDPSYHVPPIQFDSLRQDWETKTHGEGTGRKRTEIPVERKSTQATCLVQVHSGPKGLPASAFSVPGRPQPFIMTQAELQMQLSKIRTESGNPMSGDDSGSAPGKQDPQTDLIFRGNVSSSESIEEFPSS